jgi:acyl carrier protein
MTRDEIYAELTSIFREVFDDDDLTIADSTTPDDIANWNSLQHINLIMAVESDFGVKFRSSEMEKMTNVGDMIDLLEKKVR